MLCLYFRCVVAEQIVRKTGTQAIGGRKYGPKTSRLYPKAVAKHQAPKNADYAFILPVFLSRYGISYRPLLPFILRNFSLKSAGSGWKEGMEFFFNVLCIILYCAAGSSLRCNPLLSKVAFSYCSYLSWIKQKMQNFAQMVHFQITKWVCFIFTLHSVWKNPPKTYLIYLFSSAKEYEFSRQNVISLDWD